MDLILAERWDNNDGVCRASLRINEQTPEVIKILRLLTGTTNVRDRIDPDLIFQVDRNFVNAEDEAAEDKINRLLEYLFEEVPPENEVVQIFASITVLNRPFYTELLGELMYMWKALSEEKFTECFLYLYRTLERMSAACPLIFISREKDFRNAHGFLSSLYEDSKSPGELKLLQRFLQRYDTADGGFDGAWLDFNLEDLSVDFRGQLISQFRHLIQTEVKSIVVDEATAQIKIPYKDVGSFIVSVRNRTFHNEGSKYNFNLGRLGGVEPLFRLLVPGLINWFAYIFVDFARWQIARSA